MSGGSEPGVLKAGSLVAGRYRIEAEIGRGGMGVVYRAAQLPLGRPVAVKVLRRELMYEPKARMRFEREARVASALEHPAAVAIHDFGEHEGCAYLVMELLDGQTLTRRIGGAPLDVADAIELATQLADVVAAAHGSGLVHRDLKPDNVMLTGGRLRVLDFGLAFLAAGGPSGRMTREGVVVGTPAYLSPEQARGDSVGGPTDVYAMGCILHELLTGSAPFTGTEMHVLTKQMFAPPPPLSTSSMGGGPVPAALDHLRRTMLDKAAGRRPRADEVRDRLAALDPDPERGRVRSKEHGFLGARAKRMVDAPARGAERTPSAVEVGIVGAVTAELLMGLSANGFAAFTVSEDAAVEANTKAIFAPGASPDEIAVLTTLGMPVVADAARGDVARLSALLRAGASDVVLRPVEAAALARKLTRILRRGRPA